MSSKNDTVVNNYIQACLKGLKEETSYSKIITSTRAEECVVKEHKLENRTSWIKFITKIVLYSLAYTISSLILVIICIGMKTINRSGINGGDIMKKYKLSDLKLGMQVKKSELTHIFNTYIIF